MQPKPAATPVAGTTSGGMDAMAAAAGIPPEVDPEEKPEEKPEEEEKAAQQEQKINETFGRWKKLAGIIRGNM